MHIATQQCQMEDEAARSTNRVLICDTDAFATGVWHERYLGSRASQVEAIATNRRYHLYLLTDVDIPFVQDGTRDGEHIRHAMHERFKVRLAEAGHPYVLLSGAHAERLEKACAAIDAILATPEPIEEIR